MFERKKGYFKVNTQGSLLMPDETVPSFAATKSLSVPTIKTQKRPVILERTHNIISTPNSCENISALDLVNTKILGPRIEIITDNGTCNRLSHQCLILPPETTIRLTIEGGEISSVKSELRNHKDLLPFSKLKNWFHQYLTLWMLVVISLLQLFMTTLVFDGNNNINLQLLLSYIVKGGTDDELQENYLRVCACGHSAPSG